MPDGDPLSALEADVRERLSAAGLVVVGVDGPGGSGKSTLARDLARRFGDTAVIVEGDDFYRPRAEHAERSPAVGEGYDWRRLRGQVLDRLRRGEAARYQRYDWEADRLDEWITIPPRGLVIVEGVYTLRRELRHLYTLSVWVIAPREVRLQRGLERDGEEARARWAAWMAEEDRYIQEHDPADDATYLADGSEGGVRGGAHGSASRVFGRPW
jgi:uridine kinase